MIYISVPESKYSKVTRRRIDKLSKYAFKLYPNQYPNTVVTFSNDLRNGCSVAIFDSKYMKYDKCKKDYNYFKNRKTVKTHVIDLILI